MDRSTAAEDASPVSTRSCHDRGRVGAAALTPCRMHAGLLTHACLYACGPHVTHMDWGLHTRDATSISISNNSSSMQGASSCVFAMQQTRQFERRSGVIRMHGQPLCMPACQLPGGEQHVLQGVATQHVCLPQQSRHAAIEACAQGMAPLSQAGMHAHKPQPPHQACLQQQQQHAEALSHDNSTVLDPPAAGDAPLHALARDVMHGSRRAVARAITLVESSRPADRTQAAALLVLLARMRVQASAGAEVHGGGLLRGCDAEPFTIGITGESSAHMACAQHALNSNPGIHPPHGK